MVEKVTLMRLKVDLQCPSCYKKVKKILCKFPQIRDQVYDEKQNLVTITVVCCNPQKIRDKLCCKGCKVIKSIEIVEPPPPPKPEKPKPPPEKAKPPPKKPPEEPPVTGVPPHIVLPPPSEPEKPKPPPAKPKPPPAKPPEEPPVTGVPPHTVLPPPSEPEKPKPPPAKPPEKPPVVPYEPCSHPPVPVGFCCVPCSEGYRGGPCYYGYGRPVPPPPCYDSCGYGDGYGYTKGYPYSRCDYFSEENTASCTIM